MFQVPGPISARLLLEHGEDAPGWWPTRAAHPYARPAECGWPVCGRQYSPAGPSIARQHADRPGPTVPTAA